MYEEKIWNDYPRFSPDLKTKVTLNLKPLSHRPPEFWNRFMILAKNTAPSLESLKDTVFV